MLNNCFSSRPATDVSVDVGDDAVVATVSVNTLRTDVWSDLGVLVGLAGGFIILLAGEVKDGLVGATIGVDMLIELGLVVVVVATIALKVFVTALCVGGVRSGV